MDPNKVKVELDYTGADTTIQHGIISISINQAINSHHYFEVRLRADTLEDFDKPLMNNSQNNVGKSIKITLDTTVFIGLITKISVSRDSPLGLGYVIVSGMSPSFLLEGYPNVKSFTKKALGDIIKAAISDYSQNITKFGSGDVNPKNTSTIEYLTQYDENCFQFINRLAFDFGEWFYYDGTKTYFGLPASPPTVKLSMGGNLFSFDLALNVDHVDFNMIFYEYVQYQQTQKANTDGTKPTLDALSETAMKASSGISGFTPLNFGYDVLDESNASQTMDDVLTIDAGVAGSQLAAFSGVSNCPDLALGVIIDVGGKSKDGKSDISYGKYRIIGLSHVYSEENDYQNRFKAVPQELTYPPGHKVKLKQQAPAQPAIVKDNADPQNLGRVQVQFYWQVASGDQTPWVRVVSPYAGDSRGFYFIPEKGDEVLVDFYDNNPDLPYVVGSLYNGNMQPPNALVESSNYGKGIITMGGNNIIISDDDNKQKITISNSKNTLTLDCDSDNGITISSDSNITIQSQKDISITAQGKIEMSSQKDFSISAQGKVDIQAQQDLSAGTQTSAKITAVQQITIDAGTTGSVKVNGGMIDIEGAQSAKMAGAMVDVEGSGMTTIKGATVMIN